MVSVASGLRHSITVTDDGCVYCCGAGKKGQLGNVDSAGKPYITLAVWTQGKHNLANYAM